MLNKSAAVYNFLSLEELLLHHGEKYGSKQAIISYDPDSEETQQISYKDLYEIVHKTAGFMLSCGIHKGDRIAILMHNNPEIILLELAAALIGVTTVPLDYKRDTMDRKIYKLRETNAKALYIKFENSQNDSEFKELKKEIPKLNLFSWESFGEYLKVINESLLSLRGAKRRGNLSTRLNSHSREIPRYTRNDIHFVDDFSSTFVILYTSGTTAHPKGAILSLFSCLRNADGIAKWQKFTSDDKFSIILPLHHINSTIFGLSMILVGGTIILNSRYSASRFWEVIEKFKVTNTSVVPTILHDLLMKSEDLKRKQLDISTLKRICIGSAPVLPDETLKFYKTFGVRVVQGYGQTETALRVAGVPVNVDDNKYIEMVKNNTIGNSLANNELAIMDSNNNRKKENEEGEICIKGPILADGYLNDKEATAHAFKKGWFHSGDLGKYKIINGEKYYFIIGRIREIIIKGGVNLSPSAIEDGLLKTFSDIDEVAVVGFPDTRMGEEIAAVIVPKIGLSEKEVDKLKREILSGNQEKILQNISKYELPKKVFKLNELPKTSTGKIQRVIVKKMIIEQMKKYYIRKIKSSESEVLEKAVEINNSRFMGLPALFSEFKKRVENGLLLGAFEEKEGLVGTISCLQDNLEKLNKYKTWHEATSNGTLKNNDKKGDTILCVAISMRSKFKVQSSKFKVNSTLENRLRKLAKKYITQYVNSGKDHVINFHRKPKGGLLGAEVWKILENGRIDDKESMGFNVLMKYPEMNKKRKIVKSQNVAPSIMLIEEILSFAQKQGIKNVVAFSRPAGFREHLISKIQI